MTSGLLPNPILVVRKFAKLFFHLGIPDGGVELRHERNVEPESELPSSYASPGAAYTGYRIPEILRRQFPGSSRADE
jgi:hypothetical protein